jgi:hypothetical protein
MTRRVPPSEYSTHLCKSSLPDVLLYGGRNPKAVATRNSDWSRDDTCLNELSFTIEPCRRLAQVRFTNPSSIGFLPLLSL